MYRARNIPDEPSDRVRGLASGGIGAMHRLAQPTGLVDAIDRHVELLKAPLPDHESDHVLGLAYNVLCGGTCLQDIELRRQDEVYLDGLGTQRIPDRRVDEGATEALQTAINETRVRVWRAQPAACFDEAMIDADGALAETPGPCKEGMDIAYTGVWGYHPLVVSLAKPQEPLYVVTRRGNRPSAAGAWTPLVRRAPYEVATEPRARPVNVQAATIVEREFTNLRLESEAVAEVPYQPTACTTASRMVVVRKNISVERGAVLRLEFKALL